MVPPHISPRVPDTEGKCFPAPSAPPPLLPTLPLSSLCLLCSQHSQGQGYLEVSEVCLSCKVMSAYLIILYTWSLQKALVNAPLQPSVRRHPPAARPNSQIPHLNSPFGHFASLCSPILCIPEANPRQESVPALPLLQKGIGLWNTSSGSFLPHTGCFQQVQVCT